MFIRAQPGGVWDAANPDIEKITHLIILGRTGMRKTVMLKSVIEDMVLAGIPVIVVDPKGDIASMGVPNAYTDIWRVHHTFQHDSFEGPFEL